MNIMLKKLKRASKFKTALYMFESILYLITLLIFIFMISKLNGIETFLRIFFSVLFVIWYVFYVIVTPVTIITKKKAKFAWLTFFTTTFIIIFIAAIFVINVVFGGLENFNKQYINYTTNLITLNDTEFNDDSTIGMISNELDIEGYILANKLIKSENLNNDIIYYDDYHQMLADLYSGEIDAMFVSANFAVLFSSDEPYLNIRDEVKIVFKFSELLENKDYEIVAHKDLDEPFSILLMGVDSEFEGLNENQSFNGDTLMLLTFNPNTLSATMLSIPRDTYVPIACRNNASAKINSSAVYGTECVIDTVSQMTDIEIDYYVKLNFKAVVDLVDALGGITVDVEEPDFSYNHGHYCEGKFCEQDSNRSWADAIYLDPGVQELNGEEALAYARCRALYLESDIARNRHQQEIVAATAKEFSSLRSIEDFTSVLDAVSTNIDTNISTEQLFSFYDVAKTILLDNDNLDELINIQTTRLEYYDLPIILPGTSYPTSALGYYKSSMEAITKAMKVNLELIEPTINTSFSIAYNEDYTSSVIGSGLRDNDIVHTVPSLVNKTLSNAEVWATSNGISYSVEYVDSTDINYNSSVVPGLIANQSVPRGTILSSVNSIVFYINNASDPANEPENDETVPDVEIPGFPE